MRIHILFILYTIVMSFSTLSTSNDCWVCIDAGKNACSNSVATSTFTSPSAVICCSAAELLTTCKSYTFCQNSSVTSGKYGVCSLSTSTTTTGCGSTKSGYTTTSSSVATKYGFSSFPITDACVIYFTDTSPSYKTTKFKYTVTSLTSGGVNAILYIYNSIN